MIEQLNLYISLVAVSVDACVTTVGSVLFLLKSGFLKLIFMLTKQENHSFYITLLSGNKKLLTVDQDLLLKTTGMQHIFSVSGMHLSMILVGCRFILKRFLGISTALPLVALIWIYAYLVDLRPSVIRAATMTTISLFIAHSIKRKVSSLYLLLLAVVVIVSINPAYIEEVGFQLSVAGVVGVTTSQYFSSYKDISNLWSNNFSEIDSRRRQRVFPFNVLSVFVDTLFVTIFASLFIFPLVLFYFGEVTFSSLLANPLVLWIVPYVMIAGFLQIGLELFLAAFSNLNFFSFFLSLIVDIPLTILLALLEFVARVPFYVFKSDSVAVSSIFLYYLVLITLLLVIHSKKRSSYQVSI